MKKIITLFVLLTSTLFYAQSSGITYQAVLYNPGGEILPGNNNLNAVLSNKDICLRFSITDAQTSLEYQETQKVKTDEFGMVNVVIGQGGQIGGYASNFDAILWNSTTKKLQVEMDTTGNCSVFIEVSDQDFSAVPFAYASKTAENVSGIVAIANGGTGASTVVGAKTNLGLNNVDNTSDANKPISTATQTALDTKAPLASPALTGTPTVPTATIGTNTTQIANTAFVTSAIAAAATPDATATVKGKIKLTGDLGGTADAPTVPGLANKENTIAAGTTAQYYRGDKSWQTLDKTVVGLSNADNTSDANKPVSTATQTALNIKEDSANKSTDTALGFSDVLFPTQKAVKTYVDAQITSGVVDATNTTKGKIVLAGDLAGTADTPTIAANAITTTKIATGAVTDAKITSVSSSKITGSIPVTQVNGAVTKVNGVLPNGDGSVVIPFGMVRTGTLAARPIAGTTTNGDIYVVSGDSNTNNNGLTFISDGTNWNEVTPNQASLDARYLKLGGGTMSGNIIVPAGQFISIADAPTSPIDAANKAYVDSRVTSGATPDATTTSFGKIQLAGDLRGTAEAPTVPGLVSKAPLDSPSLTGIPSAPTAVSGTSTTQIATTEFVTNALSASNSNARSGDLDMNGNAILNISNARMAQLAIFDEEAHPFFDGGTDVDAITILNRENHVTQFLDGRTGTTLLAITNSVNSVTPSTEEGKIGIGTRTPSEKLEVLGNIKADKFIKTGGTPSQFLKADGSVDSNTYLTTSSAAGAYETTIAAGTTSQYYRGDKSWQTLDKTVVGLGNVDNTSDANKPVSTATQTALDTKVDKVTGKGLSTEDYTTTEKNKLAGIAAGAEVNVNADWNATTGDAQILNKPTIPSIAGLATETFVNNGLALKENTIAAGTTSQYYRGDKSWQTLDKTVVGLSNVNNTADLDKPISNDTQTVLNLKAPLASPTFTGDAKAVTATTGDSDTSLATTAFVSTAITNAATPVATTSSLGKIQLGGDLAGASSSATSPVISNNAITTAKIIDGAVTNAKIGETIAVENGGTGSNMTTTAGYVKQATTGANLSTVSTIPVADVTGAVRSVNGVVPASNGNVAVIIGRVFTGSPVIPDLATSIINASPPKQSSDIYVVASSGNPNNGRTFIYDGTTWLEVATDLSTTDSRYVNVAGDTMEGNLTIPTGTKIIITDAPTGSTDAVNKAYVDGLVTSSATPDATASVKGKIKLAGDLGGTSDAPTVVTNAITSAKILDGTIITDDLAAASVTNAKIGETITVAKGGTGVATLTGYVKGTGTTAMTASSTIPVADVTGAQTIANLSTDITADTGSDTKYPSVKVVETAVASKVGGSGTTNYVPKFSAAKTLTDSSIFDDGTSVGIKTTSPTSTLHIENPLSATNTVNANAKVLTLSRPATFSTKWDNIAQFNLGSYAVASASTDAANTRLDLDLNDGSGITTSNVMTWQANGNIGIGTTAPTNKLEIKQGTAGNSGLRFTNLNSSSAATTSASKVLGLNSTGDVILTNIPGTQNIVDFSTATPTTSGVVFTPNTPADQSVVYQSAIDNSLWTYNGSTYVTYTAPSSTAWFTSGTTNDAGNSKISNIYRTGRVGIGTNNPVNNLDVVGGFNLRNTSGAAGSNYAMEFNTNANSPRIDWVSNGSYIGQFSSDANDFYLRNSKDNTGNIRFFTKTSTIGNERMTILNNGNVGIGITAPVTKLNIQGPTAVQAANASAGMIRMSRPSQSGVKWDNIAQFNLGTHYDSGNAMDAKSRLDLALTNGADNTTLTTTMTWLANGNVGINNTAPSAPLVVQGVTGTGSLKLIAPSVTAGDNWWMGFGHGTTSTDANDRARIGVDIVAGGAGRLFFTTGASGSQTRAMFIDESQRVGIGTSSPVAQLHTTGSVRLAGAGTPGAGKVLTSDASGNATWQPVNFATAVTNQTGDFTLTAADSGSVIVVNNATTPVIVTVPSALAIGFYCQIIQSGAGQVNVVGSGGITITSALGNKSRAIGSSIGIMVTNSTTAFLSGDTAF